MTLDDFKKLNLPDGPGVYFFKKGIDTLYIGKATSLRDRVRSYLNDDLIQTRGRLLVDMVVQADTITYQETDSVLEAFILESELIKKYLPRYNTKEKDNKSFNYVVITREDFPRVLVVRGRNLEKANEKIKAGATKQEQIASLGFEYTDVFGPFPFGAELREAMKLIRRIFPYRDKCEPYIPKFVSNSGEGLEEASTSALSSDGSKITNINTGADATAKGKPCFNRSIGLCPGVCTGEMSEEEYATQVSHIRNFFKGKKQAIVADLKKQMHGFAEVQKFEEANEVKKTLSALSHIHDISMIKKDAQFGHAGHVGHIGKHSNMSGSNFSIRAEAYDIAHMSGKDMVGVMVVMHDGDFVKDQYKKFNIREIKASNDTGALKQMLERRFKHIGHTDVQSNWPLPTHIVLDGGIAQMHVAEEVLNTVCANVKSAAKSVGENAGDEAMYVKLSNITIVAVTKDETHKAKSILCSTIFDGRRADTAGNGADNSAHAVIFDDGDIISINQECHRFAIATHRKRRSLSRGL
ncbi:MAG: hypothetical protein KBB54_00545 [Candidatus Pacebacteria bacterium]|nr:hypothetical protein [Candidatus Paceibacterota bacterium]MBP9819023.1 hypothetical protein [Candidatus Paceibacterota bacterium]